MANVSPNSLHFIFALVLTCPCRLRLTFLASPCLSASNFRQLPLSTASPKMQVTRRQIWNANLPLRFPQRVFSPGCRAAEIKIGEMMLQVAHRLEPLPALPLSCGLSDNHCAAPGPRFLQLESWLMPIAQCLLQVTFVLGTLMNNLVFAFSVPPTSPSRYRSYSA